MVRFQSLAKYKQMRALILLILFLVSVFDGIAQDRVEEMRYIGFKINESKNISFLNKEFIFLRGGDTIVVNAKLSFNIDNPMFFSIGIYHNCHLKLDSIYTLTLKRICINEIPEWHHSYYRTNAIFDEDDCSRFIEVENNTLFQYANYSTKYVDIKGVLYKIVGLKPDDNCFYP